MANQAAFEINGTPSVDPTTGDQEFTATHAQTLTVRLEVNPSLALSARFEVFDATDSESPFASKDAPLLTWVDNSLPAITLGAIPFGINDEITIVMPATAVSPLPNIHSYVIRCTVATPGDGSPGSQTQVFERQVMIFGTLTTPAIRKTVPGETTQARVRAWSDSLNDVVEAVENSGGGGASGGWSSDGIPPSPNAKDDEFDGSTLDLAKWTVFDQNTVLTTAVASSQLSLTRPTNAAIDLVGVFQAVPVVNDYTIWTKISMMHPLNVSVALMGSLFLAEDLDADPTGAAWALYGVDVGASTPRLASVNRSDFTASSSFGNTRNTIDRVSVWFRMRVSGTTVDLDYSWDGVGWTEKDAAYAHQLGSIDTFGVCLDNRSTQTATIYIDYIRVTESSNVFSQVNGGPL